MKDLGDPLFYQANPDNKVRYGWIFVIYELLFIVLFLSTKTDK